jgi:hypothetical protein
MGEQQEQPNDEQAKRLRAERLRKAMEDAVEGRRPLTPREFTDRAAREAAEKDDEKETP